MDHQKTRSKPSSKGRRYWFSASLYHIIIVCCKTRFQRIFHFYPFLPSKPLNWKGPQKQLYTFLPICVPICNVCGSKTRSFSQCALKNLSGAPAVPSAEAVLAASKGRPKTVSGEVQNTLVLGVPGRFTICSDRKCVHHL